MLEMVIASTGFLHHSLKIKTNGKSDDLIPIFSSFNSEIITETQQAHAYKSLTPSLYQYIPRLSSHPFNIK